MSEASGNNRTVRLRKTTVRLVGMVLGISLMAGSASLLFASDAYTPSLAGRVIAVALVIAFAYLGFRSLRLGVEVHGGTLVVRNLVRTHLIPATEVSAVVMPNQTAAQAIPKLRLKNGGDVGLLGLSRTKNRAWGQDRTTERLVSQLASLCEVPVLGEEGTGGFHWG